MRVGNMRRNTRAGVHTSRPSGRLLLHPSLHPFLLPHTRQARVGRGRVKCVVAALLLGKKQESICS